ncbi:MAG: hypothetical protein WAL71_14510 [Terriglobales bacterium]
MRSFQHFFVNWNRGLLKTTVITDTGCRSDPDTSPTWRALYVAALFETDEARMMQRIAEAKKALAVRARVLFQSAGDHRQEQSAIEATLQSLRVLEQCKGRLQAEAVSGAD